MNSSQCTIPRLTLAATKGKPVTITLARSALLGLIRRAEEAEIALRNARIHEMEARTALDAAFDAQQLAITAMKTLLDISNHEQEVAKVA